QRDEGAKLTEQTRGQYEAVFRLFEQYTGNASLSSITRANAADFLEIVAKLHPHWGRSPKTKELTFKEIVERFGAEKRLGQGDKGLSNRTVNRYVTSLHGVFKWARKRGQFTGENPFAEQSRPEGHTRNVGYLPLMVEELNKLFRSPILVD